MIQWLRLCLPIQWTWVQSLVCVLRSYMSCSPKTKIQNKNNIVINSIKTLKYGLHQKNIFKKDLQWVTFIFCCCHISCSVLCDSLQPNRLALQAPLLMGLSRQQYWSRLPFPPPGDLLDLGIESRSLTLKADSLPSEPPRSPHYIYIYKLLLYGHCLGHCQCSIFLYHWQSRLITRM